MTPPLRLCYIHVYKCGGSSMRQYIVDHLVTPETRLVDQWAYEWERRISPPDRVLGNVTRAEYLRFQAVPPEHSGPVVILTHCFFYEQMKRWPGFSFATLLRDPVERAVSQFYFQRRVFEHFQESDLRAWLDGLPSFELNMQTAAFCGAPDLAVSRVHLEMAKANLHAFDFVGFVDDYPESLRLFDRIYGVAAGAATPELNATPYRPRLAPEVRELLAERCALDRELLDYARRLFRAKRAALEMIDAGDPALAPPSLLPGT
jgi:hypothetical protein